MRIPKIPLIERYILKSDPDGETYVEFRQARRGEEEKRRQMLDDMTWMFDDTGGFGGLRQNNTQTAVNRMEVYMTLAGCNLEFELPDGKTEPVFRFRTDRGVPTLAMSEAEFEKAWSFLPPEVAEEIVELCHQHNAQWYMGES
jgi:hypothetical protein